MVVEVNFFGGAGDYEHGELGGVQGLFHDQKRKTRFLLDCGQRPDHTNQYYGFPYKPKAFQMLALSEFLEFYPNLDNLYRHDYEVHRGKKTGALPLEGILVTHPHYDHVGGLTFIRHDMPVFMHRLAKQILWLWQYTGGRTINQFVDLYDQFSQVSNTQGGKKFLFGDEAVLTRNIQLYQEYERFKLGNLPITPYLVDHSTPGSCGFVVESSVGNIAISGDIRKRGRHPENTERFVTRLTKGDLSYIFWEGSLLHFEHQGNEDDVASEVEKRLKNHNFAAVAYPPRDFDRITSMYLAAKAAKRMLVIPPAQAIALKLLDGINGYPKTDWKYIGVLLPRKKKGLIDREDFDESIIEKDYYWWERQFLRLPRWKKHEGKIQRVSVEDLKNNQDQFLTFLSFSSMLDVLEEVQPVPNSIFIRSHPGPWTKEMEIQEDRQVNILKQFGMYAGPEPDVLTPSIERNMCQIHVTGHLNRDETREILDSAIQSNPGVTIVPYHCMHPPDFPEDVAKTTKKIIIPQRGEKFVLN